MARSLTSRNLLDKRPGRTVEIQNEILKEVIGPAEARGCWLIYGVEKHGKTWLALFLAKALSYNEKIAYISAEEGTDASFQLAAKRAGLTKNDKVTFDEYMPIDEIITKYSKPKTARIIFTDNMSIYADEFKMMKVKQFLDKFPNKLIVFVAHEERKDAYPACAKMAKKWAKVIFNVIGLRAHVISRFSIGGTFDINPDKCQLYWGEKEEQNN